VHRSIAPTLENQAQGDLPVRHTKARAAAGSGTGCTRNRASPGKLEVVDESDAWCPQRLPYVDSSAASGELYRSLSYRGSPPFEVNLITEAAHRLVLIGPI
jgi:hypothetical protein